MRCGEESERGLEQRARGPTLLKKELQTKRKRNRSSVRESRNAWTYVYAANTWGLSLKYVLRSPLRNTLLFHYRSSGEERDDGGAVHALRLLERGHVLKAADRFVRAVLEQLRDDGGVAGDVFSIK